MKRLVSALLVLAAAGCGGVDVQGIVRDERTGEPLPGATVKIGDEETSTDYRGFYELEVDEDEAQQLSVDKSGYRAFNEDVSFEGVDEVIQDIDLAPRMQQDQGLEHLEEDPMQQDDSMQLDQDLPGQGGMQEGQGGLDGGGASQGGQ